ncbi:TPA: hypothetical protein RZK37_001751 [Campylobacter coli]|nr:hypothetical protein [Campylobacter coli]
MKYIILTFILGLIVFVSVKGCFYPTSYRAFIPKSLDSEYKEFERLCKEEVGKVVYARPIKHGIKLEDLFNLPSTSVRRVALSRHMYMLIENVTTREDEIFYLHIAGFEYYTGWTRKSFSMHDDSKKYIRCEPLLYGKTWKENAKIMEQKAFDNKEYIGTEEYLRYSPYHYEYNTLYRQIVNFKQKKEN